MGGRPGYFTGKTGTLAEASEERRFAFCAPSPGVTFNCFKRKLKSSFFTLVMRPRCLVIVILGAMEIALCVCMYVCMYEEGSRESSPAVRSGAYPENFHNLFAKLCDLRPLQSNVRLINLFKPVKIEIGPTFGILWAVCNKARPVCTCLNFYVVGVIVILHCNTCNDSL